MHQYDPRVAAIRAAAYPVSKGACHLGEFSACFGGESIVIFSPYPSCKRAAEDGAQ